MAFGFPASYETEEELTASRSTARDAVVYAFEMLGWRFVNPELDVFVANVGGSAFSWGERMIISLSDPGKIRMKSSCFLQLFDWGKNKRNVTDFLTHFSGRLLRDNLIGEKEPMYLDESGNTPIDRVIGELDKRS